MLDETLLDLQREDVLTALVKRLVKCLGIVVKLFTSDDCILTAASDVAISPFAKENLVTGVHTKNPILIPMHSFCCFLRIAPVAFHDGKAGDA